MDESHPLRSMRKTTIWIVALVGLLALPAAASADDFDTYMACERVTSASPSHRCEAGESIGAFFRSNVGDVTYDICVRFPAGQELCSRGQVARARTLYVNPVTAPEGRLVATWSVAGEVVGQWTLNVGRRSTPGGGPVRRTCGLLPGEGAFSYIKTVGIRCQAAKRVAAGARDRFCSRHNDCESSTPFSRYRGKVRYRGWSCRVRDAWEFLQVKCRKGEMRLHQEAGA